MHFLLKSLLLSLFFTCTLVKAQNLSWTKIDGSDGLASDTVHAVYAESDSLIWIGTEKGLCRYNGQQVSFLFNGAVNANRQKVHEILKAQGDLWLRTEAGISRLANGSFTNYDTTNGLLSLPVTDIEVDAQDNLWIGSQHGVSKFDGTSFTHYPSISASVLGIDSADRVYVMDPAFLIPSISTLKVFNGQVWDTIPPKASIGVSPINRLFKSHDGRLIAQTNADHFFEFNYPFNPVQHSLTFPQGSTIYNALAVDGAEVWLGQYSFGSSLFYTKDSILRRHNAGFVKVNQIELFKDRVYVASDFGLAYASSEIKPLALKEDFNLNDISISIDANQSLFNDQNQGASGFSINAFGNAIYNAEFITVGKNPNWTHNPEYYGNEAGAGPYNNQELGFEWPYVLKISQAEINQHRANYNQSGYSVPESIEKWPANGDSTLGMRADLAPYRDVNGNGCYDPTNGDYPIIKGDAALYWVRHSKQTELKMEYHYMLYALSGANNPDLNQTVFLDFRIINRETSRIDSLKTGLFIDWDLGNPQNDYLGCDSLSNTFYVYSGDSVENRLVNGNLVFEHNIPFVGARFLSDSMMSFIQMFNRSGQTSPTLTIQYYNYLNAIWPNASKLTYGGDGLINSSGIPTNYMLTGNPLTGMGWTAANPGYGHPASPPGDRRGIASIPFYSLNPGESKTISVALGFGRKDSVQSHLENFPEMQRVLASAKTAWDSINTVTPDYSSNFNCTLVGISEQAIKSNTTLHLFPNPTEGFIELRSSEVMERWQLFSLNGQMLRNERISNKNGLLDLSELQRAIYLLRVQTASGKWVSRKLIISK